MGFKRGFVATWSSASRYAEIRFVFGQLIVISYPVKRSTRILFPEFFINFCSSSRALAMRDLTVPIDISRVSAISS